MGTDSIRWYVEGKCPRYGFNGLTCDPLGHNLNLARVTILGFVVRHSTWSTLDACARGTLPDATSFWDTAGRLARLTGVDTTSLVAVDMDYTDKSLDLTPLMRVPVAPSQTRRPSYQGISASSKA
jgi:hypothetical protein